MKDLSRARAVLSGLAAIYPSDRWALVPQVYNATGAQDGVRIADAFAVALLPSMGGEVHQIEIKVSASDLAREDEEKSAPFLPYVTERWIAVPAPWNRVVTGRGVLPEGWGLYSIGTGKPEIIHPAGRRAARVELDAFTLALLRAAGRHAPREEGGPERDPEASEEAFKRQILRPGLGRGKVVLSCGHEVVGMLPKPGQRGAWIVCFDCMDKIATPLEATLDRIAGAAAEELPAIQRAIDDRRRRVA